MNRKVAFFLALIVLALTASAIFIACNKPAEQQNAEEPDPEPISVAEVKEFGYTIEDHKINYAVCLKNVNEHFVMPAGKYIARLTMSDENGTEIDACYIETPELYPGVEVWTAGTYYLNGSNWDSISDVQISLYDLADAASHLSLKDAKHQVYTPLQVTITNKTEKEVSGEIINYNHYNIDTVKVVLIFRDENGVLKGGYMINANPVAGDDKTPFSVYFSEEIKDIVSVVAVSKIN